MAISSAVLVQLIWYPNEAIKPNLQHKTIATNGWVHAPYLPAPGFHAQLRVQKAQCKSTHKPDMTHLRLVGLRNYFLSFFGSCLESNNDINSAWYDPI